ncbi:MAG: hypothetical protein ABWZ57_05420 [Mesorhizobium sp.]
MTRLLLAFAAWAALVGGAAAGDFSATLHYPEAPVKQRPASGLDRQTTGSILKSMLKGKHRQPAKPESPAPRPIGN